MTARTGLPPEMAQGMSIVSSQVAGLTKDGKPVAVGEAASGHDLGAHVLYMASAATGYGKEAATGIPALQAAQGQTHEASLIGQKLEGHGATAQTAEKVGFVATLNAKDKNGPPERS